MSKGVLMKSVVILGASLVSAILLRVYLPENRGLTFSLTGHSARFLSIRVIAFWLSLIIPTLAVAVVAAWKGLFARA
jgi:hypothetical protein